MLQASGLDVGYPGRVVGRGYTLSLPPGQVLALLGPNGGGKTTLLKTLLGLLPPLAGQVQLDGQALGRLTAVRRARRLAYVPQGHAGAFAFSVADLVLMGRTAHGSLFTRPSAHDLEVVQAALRRLGIAHLAQQPATLISGGERQLALIARAMVQQAGFVLLDEPTSALDFGNQGKVMREIRRLADEGLGVAFSTHDPNHARRYAHQALLVHQGGTLAQGPVAEVLTAQTLATLYGAPVETLADPGGHCLAFLPG